MTDTKPLPGLQALFDEYVAGYLAGTLGASTPAAGLPYPAATDPVYQGAAAIQALATALDPLVASRYGVLTRNPGPSIGSGAGYVEMVMSTTEKLLGVVNTSGRLIAPVTGLYHVEVRGTCPSVTGAAVTTYCTFAAYVNGAVDARCLVSFHPDQINNWQGYASALTLNAGDAVSMCCQQNTGAAVTVANLRVALALIAAG